MALSQRTVRMLVQTRPLGRQLSTAPLITGTTANGSTVDVAFSDGSTYRFHNMWLRDSCRDSGHVQASTERVLDSTPLTSRLEKAEVKTASVVDGNQLKVQWADGVVHESSFDGTWLRTYADFAGKLVSGEGRALNRKDDWFYFIDGKKPVLGKDKDSLKLWKNDENFYIPTFEYDEIPARREEFMQSILDPGMVLVNNMPDDPTCSGDVLETFAHENFGGLQKHPLRETAHWTISTEKEVHDPSNVLADEDKRKGANSYNTDQQLCNHTDQSLYGTPGLLLGFHCAFGEGGNSLTDGFAVAYALRERHPEYYKALTQIGMTAGRYLSYYSANTLEFDTQHPVISEDEFGNIHRVQYHEIYRTALTVSYDDFPLYWEALRTFYNMVHSPEFQIHTQLRQNQLLFFNNWRTMHGRAGLKGKARTILGGTVTRDAFYSRMRKMMEDDLKISPEVACGVPTYALRNLAGTR